LLTTRLWHMTCKAALYCVTLLARSAISIPEGCSSGLDVAAESHCSSQQRVSGYTALWCM
jgi:hypothetical protein